LSKINKPKKSTRNSWLFVPSQYFAEGVPFVLVNQLSVALFKSLHESNVFIGFTSLLYLPWSLKLLWGPIVDAYFTKRKWVVSLQLVLGICFALIAIGLYLPQYIFITLVLFTLIAFISATHDIATDGFYLHALQLKDQAFFTGIRSTFYRFAMIFAGGLLVSIAGGIGIATGNIQIGWSVAFALTAIIFICLFFYHKYILPYPVTDVAVKDAASSIPYKLIFKEYFTQPKIGIILAYILLYRFGEGLLIKMAQPFFLDKPSVGGMGLSLSEVGIYYGTVGIVTLVIGGIIGGWFVKKYGLKKMLLPMALSIHLPNLLYVYLASVKHDIIWSFNISSLIGTDWIIRIHPLIQSCIVVEQLGYGLGFTAYMVYLMYISRGKYKTSHYAISTGIMALGYMIPQFLSGFVQSYVGYFWLFVISVIMTFPGMFTIFFLPLEFDQNNN
jgi:PAT family beta-lactamase induction signal transducer AmpG